MQTSLWHLVKMLYYYPRRSYAAEVDEAWYFDADYWKDYKGVLLYPNEESAKWKPQPRNRKCKQQYWPRGSIMIGLEQNSLKSDKSNQNFCCYYM